MIHSICEAKRPLQTLKCRGMSIRNLKTFFLNRWKKKKDGYALSKSKIWVDYRVMFDSCMTCQFHIKANPRIYIFQA